MIRITASQKPWTVEVEEDAGRAFLSEWRRFLGGETETRGALLALPRSEPTLGVLSPIGGPYNYWINFTQVCYVSTDGDEPAA